jgi:nicotinamidase-related amidase
VLEENIMDNKALLIVDVQQAFVDGKIIPPVYKSKDLIRKINNLITKARKKEIPIIFIKHNGPENHIVAKNTYGNKIFEDLKIECSDTIIEKETPDSFYNTNLQNKLKDLKVNQIIICGIQTEVCIDTTCRSAFSKNYKIILVSDCHSTWDKEYIKAKQIIKHHNEIIGGLFAELKEESEILL